MLRQPTISPQPGSGIETSSPQNECPRVTYSDGSLLIVLVTRPYELCTGRAKLVGTFVPLKRPPSAWLSPAPSAGPHHASSNTIESAHALPWTCASIV